MDTEYDEDRDEGEGLKVSEDIRENSDILVHVAYSVAEMDAALLMDSQIHEYRSSEMGEFALQPWWGLPATLTGLALQEATAVVVHHSNLDNYGVDGLWVILQKKKPEIFNFFTWGHIKAAHISMFSAHRIH